jgi:diguanylate cyclase (GGDEF)-like protein
VPRGSLVRRQSESTIRLSRAGREKTTLAALQATLPPLTPITGHMPVLHEAPSPDTPHAIVLPVAARPDRASLTLLRGPGVGTVFTLEQGETVLGRGSAADIVLDEPSVSREHARITLIGEGAYFIEDLGSTNGTFVCGRPVRRARLASSDRVQLGGQYTFRFAILDEDEENLQKKLFESSTRDVLTGLMNRACMFEHLTRSVERSRRDGSDLAFMIIDVDHLKSINDRFGHAAGDDVLKAISLSGKRAMGEGAVFARYGGDEFTVLVRSVSAAETTALAERFKCTLPQALVEVDARTAEASVSIGVAFLSECEIVDGLELFARADARLYAAKLGGRNQICASD